MIFMRNRQKSRTKDLLSQNFFTRSDICHRSDNLFRLVDLGNDKFAPDGPPGHTTPVESEHF
jgi:hypothetical protein